MKKAHGLAIGKEILGERWARDHADDKKPVLAAALETAFDPAKSIACIGLDQAARDSAAAWLPPGMAYGDTDPAYSSCRSEADPDSELDPAARIAGDASVGEAGEIDISPTDLPAFLTEDEPAGAASSTGIQRLTLIFGTGIARPRAPAQADPYPRQGRRG